MAKNLKKLKNWHFFVLKKAAKNVFDFFENFFCYIFIYKKFQNLF